MPGSVYDQNGDPREVQKLTVYDATGTARLVRQGWLYDQLGNPRPFVSSAPKWTMNFSGPFHTCGGRTGICASTVTGSCYVPMGSVTLLSGTPPTAAFKLMHAKNSSGAAGQIVVWLNQGVVDPYMLGARIIEVGPGLAENAAVIAHIYDGTVTGYGYVFEPIVNPLAAATVHKIVFA